MEEKLTVQPTKTRKVYGAENIRRVITQTRKGKYEAFRTSKYMPHQGPREKARRCRQMGLAL